MALTNASPPMPVNCFSLPFDNIKIWELRFCHEANSKMTISMIIECTFEITFPGIPFLFAWFTGTWLANRLEQLPAKDTGTPFCYHLTAQSVISTQDLAKLLSL
jgi:hypothetical protein